MLKALNKVLWLTCVCQVPGVLEGYLKIRNGGDHPHTQNQRKDPPYPDRRAPAENGTPKSEDLCYGIQTDQN